MTGKPRFDRRTAALRLDFHRQRANAKARGIAWKLTYEQWLHIWVSSEHLHERGCRRGQWCMSRPGDKGAYEESNVAIIRIEENSREGNTGRLPGNQKLSPDKVRRMRREYEANGHDRKIMSRLAERYGVTWSNVCCIVRYKTWRHV